MAISALVGSCGGAPTDSTGSDTGTVRVTTTTTESALDTDGYLVSLDGLPFQPIASNGGTVTVPELESGS
jgi:hypothetical protein